MHESIQPPNNQQVEELDQNSSNPNNQGVNSLHAIALTVSQPDTEVEANFSGQLFCKSAHSTERGRMERKTVFQGKSFEDAELMLIDNILFATHPTRGMGFNRLVCRMSFRSEGAPSPFFSASTEGVIRFLGQNKINQLIEAVIPRNPEDVSIPVPP